MAAPLEATSRLIHAVRSRDPAERGRPLLDLIAELELTDVLAACRELDGFRRESENLYERVRAAMFLYAAFRYVVQDHRMTPPTGLISFDSYHDLLERRFEQAISGLHAAAATGGMNAALASALAFGYEQVAFQTLADQVRRSVRGCAGSRWMFRVGSIEELPLRINARLLERDAELGLYPILTERTPVRLDLSHSAWSDIFFLGMDFPEGARVLNISVDLGVHGRDDAPCPPIETYCRVIGEPLLRLTSVDLNAHKDITTLAELFNFGNDYLGLIKAGIVASGLIPASLEGTGCSLAEILGRVIRPGLGLEVVSKVNDIPKGSRLAVSTNLLASLVALLMRATGQTSSITGPLEREDARVVVSRAILGEWLGGSGGGWQDSGGIFPGVKRILGVAATESDPEWSISTGRLLPHHELMPAASEVGSHAGFARALASSLVLVHGGMAQNVGPILNMVTEKHLLRGAKEWSARMGALRIFDEIVAAVDASDVQRLGELTTRNWDGPLKAIIPWVSNQFTESIIAEARRQFGRDFWGFLMLGGMSGGGMGFFVEPSRQPEFRRQILEIMRGVKSELDDALPFAMEPVVYDFRINPSGTQAELLSGADATMPAKYYSLQVAAMIESGQAAVDPQRRKDVDHFARRSGRAGEQLAVFRTTVNALFPVHHAGGEAASRAWEREAAKIKAENGFDAVQHAQLREDYTRGRIGLSRNRLPVDTDIRDVDDAHLLDASRAVADRTRNTGAAAISRGEVAVVTLAAGVGSRWTSGAGIVKAVNPFVALEGRHRSFLEIHLAKTARSQRAFNVSIPHVVTTGFLTHRAVERHLARTSTYGHTGAVALSRGQSIGQRLVPTARSLNFYWEEQAHQALDENKQKVRDASRRALVEWARAMGEGSDYTDNTPLQRFHPPGHFYEVPTLIRNGLLARLLREQPSLRWLMVHNVDTLGADVDPGVLGLAIDSGAGFAFEVIPRRIDDRGGGLASVNGRVRILEGLAQPREETEFRLRYYNTLTTWVNIDRLLALMGIDRSELNAEPNRLGSAVRELAARVPTYVTIKDVKRRWGHGQEDVFPVVQFEKLWGDITSLPDASCAYIVAPRARGQQLKDPAQLDAWSNDGSLDYVKSLCEFH